MKPHLHHGLTHKTLQLGDVLRRLESVTGIAPRRCGRGFQARCPAHDDRTPSLSIDHGDDGTVLLHCHAGCSFDEIRAALGECSSLAERERFVSRSETTTLSARCRKRDLALASQVYSTRQACLNAKFHKYGKPSRVWEYVDREGKAVGAVVRWDRADGSKVIRPLVCTKHGWRVGAMDRPRPLYRLDDLARAAPGSRVLVVEGEKCVDLVSGCYELATTSAGGAEAAAHSDWSPLAGMDVVIIPDADAAGERYAMDVLRLLARLPTPPRRTRIARLPGLPPGGDIAEFIDQFTTLEHARVAMEKIIRETPVVELQKGGMPTAVRGHGTQRSMATPSRGHATQGAEPVIRCAADVPARGVEWLSYGYLPKGKLTMLVGDPGVGKSFLTCDLAAALSTGRPWPTGHATPGANGHVLFIGCEDDADDTVVPRLAACGADLSRVHFLEDMVLTDALGQHYQAQFTLDDVGMLREAARALPELALVVIDPLTAYFGQADANKNADVRAALAPLTVAAAQTGVAILAVNHLTKRTEGPAVYRSLGSIGVAAAARSVLAVIHDPNSDHERVLMPVKSNVAGGLSGWRYALVDRGPDATPVLQWRGPAEDDTAEEYLRASAEGRDLTLLHALDWLRERLAGGAAPTADLVSEARHQEISRRTLFRAKDRLGIQGGRREHLGATQYMWWLEGCGMQDAGGRDANSSA